MKFINRIIPVAVLCVFGLAATMPAMAVQPSKEALKSSFEHQSKGNILDEKGDTTAAIKEYEKALSFDPEDSNTLFNLGIAYLKINKPHKAVGPFEEVIKLNNKDTEAYNLLGLAYRASGRMDEAIKVWKKSLSIDPAQTQPKMFIEEAKEL